MPGSRSFHLKNSQQGSTLSPRSMIDQQKTSAFRFLPCQSHKKPELDYLQQEMRPIVELCTANNLSSPEDSRPRSLTPLLQQNEEARSGRVLGLLGNGRHAPWLT
jgi:hypothetical protein